MASFAVKSRALIQELAGLELIASFEGGEDRESVLKKARKIWSEPSPYGWDGLPYWLVTRLMQDRDGADVVIPTRVRADLRVKDQAGWLMEQSNDHLDSFLLLVFDEQIAVLCSNNYADSDADSLGLDVIYCPRSSAFENCLPETQEYELRRDYYRRLRTWHQLGQPDIPIVTPSNVSFFSMLTRFQVEGQAACMDAIEAICKKVRDGHGLVAWCGLDWSGGCFNNLARQCFNDYGTSQDAARRAAAKAAFQKLLLDFYIHIHFHMYELPPVGAFRRQAVRGLLARLRALVQQGRAACLRDGFLYEAAPAGVFRLVVSFL